METKTPWYLHVDLDAFFASVEQLDHPEYKGKPVIVGGLPGDKRSVVSTASYEARKFGVHSAMPTYMAYKLCPQGIYVYGRMKRYAELSYQIMSIFKEYSPDVEQMSIDEAFIDITGTEKLFGPPEETAMKIKAHVKKNTGLTVSVGLATTKYLAKIASGFSKPDGFYFVRPGTEQEFMLNLPLEKVWGVGKKTLEALKKSGINSTRDIYDKSYDALEFLYGKNTANFLYNIVRGIDTVNFGHEAKNHSISAERTFVEDINDKYTAETQLMELCHGVIFRLIRDESFSRTAFLKIRYDDFSTVSIQETTDRSILTLDSYFEIIKNLFEKKYENGRGIRLLGVGFENIEKEDRPYQQDLFISSNDKKQAVEKAIIKLEKKHPEIQIKKARTLDKKTKALLFFLLISLFAKRTSKIYADTAKTIKNAGAGAILSDSFVEPLREDETTALFKYDINDKNNVEFLISGYWQANLLSSLRLNLGNNLPFALSLDAPVFTQEVDISTWILLNQKWYFETDFADGFEKNTFAMGYKGNGYLKSARISNRGITMSSEYSANAFNFGLTGGNNQAPGLSMHFADKDNNRWFGDFIIRYDMTKSNSATFYGYNSVTDFKIPPKDFLYGKSFIFPQECSSELTKIDSIYVENRKGSYTDKNGKKYKKVSASDYTILASSAKLTFAPSAQTSKQNEKIPNIIITFTDKNSVSSIITKTGSYNDSQSFAGQIQNFFNSNSTQEINISDYSYNLQTQIDNKTGLLIQNSILFSPYLCANIYDCGLSSQADIFIQSKTTEKQSTEYTASQITSDISNPTIDFLLENHLYAQVFNNNYTDKSLQKPENRYPFADTLPQIYFNLPSQEDLELVARTYSSVSNFFIDTNAIAGTVQAYINNAIDYDASYDTETGIVSLSKAVSQTDKIYVVWQEDASDYTGGAISIGSGLFYNILPSLAADFAITSRWPVFLNTRYSTVDSPSYGYSALSAGITFQKDNLSIKEKAAFSVNSDNTSGNLFVMEQNENILQTYYLGNNDGYITSAEPYLSGYSMQLSKDNNCTVKKHGGMSDTKITGYKIPLQFNFSAGNENPVSPLWAAVDIKLQNGNELKKSSNLELALKVDIKEQFADDIDVYLQLGVNANESFNGEDTRNIPTWKLTGNSDSKILTPLQLSSQQWQTVVISLSDDDRARLASENDARLLIIRKNCNPENKTNGIIYAGPYEPKTQSLFLSYDKSLIVNAYNELSPKLPSAHKLDLIQSYATKIKWNILDNEKASIHSKITGTTYFKNADFSNYKTLNLEFASSQAGDIAFILSNEASNAVSVLLKNLSAYFSQKENPVYHTLSINLLNNKVYIDENPVNASDYELQINKNVIPNKLTLIIDTQKDQQLYTNGNFFLGNIYYSETDAYYKLQNYTALNYKKDGAIISVNEYDLVKDALFNIESFQSEHSVTANSNAGITLAGIRLEGDISTDFNAGHNIQTTDSFVKFVHFGENYRFNKTEEALNKTDNIGIDLSQSKVPFKLDFSTDAKDLLLSQTQNVVFNTSISTNIKASTIGLSADYEALQKINTSKKSTSISDDYFDSWYNISKLEFSLGEEAAASRNQLFTASLFATIPFIQFNPKLSYILETQYQNLSETTFKDITTLCMEFPFIVKNNDFTVRLSRTGDNLKITQAGGTYISDSRELFKSTNNTSWIYSSIPFYDLFEEALVGKINSSSSALQTPSYETLYELEWKRKLSNRLSDLFIPSSTSFGFSRNIKGGAAQSDMYQIKCEISNFALNCFGKQSLKPVFKWYNQDEFLSSLTGIIKIPTDQLSSPTFTLSTYQQTLFYVSNESILKTGIDYIIETNFDWNLCTTLMWSREGKTSILLDFSKLLIKKLKNVNFEISRNDIFNFAIGQKDNQLKQSYEYNHNTDFSFLKYYTLTTGLGTQLIIDQNSTASLAFTLSVGAKMVF